MFESVSIMSFMVKVGECARSGDACYNAEIEAAPEYAKVAELVDALALGASGATRESSSLSFRTIVQTCPVCGTLS